MSELVPIVKVKHHVWTDYYILNVDVDIHNNLEYLLILLSHLMRSLLMVNGIYCEIGGLSIYHKNASNKMHQQTYVLLCSTLTEVGSVY